MNQGIEISLLIIKPDARLAGLEPVIRRLIGEESLEIEQETPHLFCQEELIKMYTHRQDHLFPYYEGYLCVKPSLVLRVRGEDASSRLSRVKSVVRDILGDTGFYNGVHSSDSEEDAKRELNILGIPIK